MNLKITIYTCFLLFFSMVAQSQESIKGIILNADNQPISYVNIGVKNKNLGTVANENGEFWLTIPSEFKNDTLSFSCVGYNLLQVPIKQITSTKQNKFYLVAKENVLQEVVVGTTKPSIKKIGTKSANPFLWGAITSKDGKDIVEVSKLIDIKKPARVQKIHMYLKGITVDTATFRINFYANEGEIPGSRIYEKSLLFTRSLSKGWLEINVEDYDIYMEKSFFMAVEFLPKLPGQKYSFAYGGQLGGFTFTRTNSLGSWYKNKGATASFYVTVKQ